MDRTGAECVHHRSKAKPGFETVSYRIFRRRQQHLFSPGFLKWQASKCFQNSSKEKECEFSPASLTVGCNQVGFWGPVESHLEQRAAAGQAEGAVQLLQQTDQMVNKGNVESEGRGLSKFWRSIIFSPLQHLFGGKN
ncbi:uncharacterized protein WM294_011079 isoform 1-T2 [Sarcoramphus papa]